MKLHLLVTPDMINIIPETTKILFKKEIEYTSEEELVKGENMILEDTRENFIKWLKPFDGIWIGTGDPQHESFQIMHIKDED